MSNDNDGMKIFAGFLIGAAVGAVLGLLFAPQSGNETRNKIKDLSKKVEDDVIEGFEKVSEAAKSFADKAKNKFGDKKSEA
jgi:gas vesicle protein